MATGSEPVERRIATTSTRNPPTQITTVITTTANSVLIETQCVDYGKLDNNQQLYEQPVETYKAVGAVRLQS